MLYGHTRGVWPCGASEATRVRREGDPHFVRPRCFNLKLELGKNAAKRSPHQPEKGASNPLALPGWLKLATGEGFMPIDNSEINEYLLLRTISSQFIAAPWSILYLGPRGKTSANCCDRINTAPGALLGNKPALGNIQPNKEGTV